MPLTHHISISVQALTPNRNPCLLPALINRLITLIMPLINELVIVNTNGCYTPAQTRSSFPCQKPTLYKARVVFSKPVHAVGARGGPPGPNYGPSVAAKPSSHHMHSTLWVTPPTSSPFCSRRTSAQCDVMGFN